ncbi:MAG: chemotaxis protein CheB [Chloroflexota bacterium]|nr:MAG: chemotaxis protein CheB [Chloroflexota bacterium]
MEIEGPAFAARTDIGAKLPVIAIASSAGGLRALGKLLVSLPEDLPAALLIVQHLDPSYPSMLVHLLSQQTALKVLQAVDGQLMQAGVAYIAPPNYHLFVNPGCLIGLSQAEKVHFLRPSADILFESVAQQHGKRAIAVILTGTGSDGSKGAIAIHNHGGVVIAQDKATSEFFGMPGSAAETGIVNYTLPLQEIGPALIALVNRGTL